MSTDYPAPVSKLLTYGEGQRSSPENWSKYPELGLGPEHILELIADLRDRTGKTFIIATHDTSVASHADRTIQLVDGLIAGVDTLDGQR